MSYLYRNRNTGDEVSYEERSGRLDRLDNWELISQPQEAPAPAPAPSGAEEGELSGRPGKADPKAAWVSYIADTTDLSEAEAQDLTKAELIALTADK